MEADAADRARREEGWAHDERYQQLVELAPDAILVHDDGWIVLANAAAVRLAGATRRAQLIGRAISTFLDPPYLKAVQTRLTDTGDTGPEGAPVRDTFRRLDGGEVAVEVLAVAFLDAGRPAAHLIVRDITGRLDAEQSARDVEERRHEARTAESIGVLAGGLAHEINNMMAVILGLGELLAASEQVPDAARADAREILTAGERVANVTRQLLAFSRRAAHRPQVVSLGGAVRDMAVSLRRLLGERHKLKLVAAAPSRVWVDLDQLEHLVVNLVLNARDAMSDGGTVTIRTAESVVEDGSFDADGAVIPPGRYATLAVGDTGTGMDLATQARIFEPFYTTRDNGKQSGLGLAAVEGVVKQNGGYITVASTPGNGAMFTLHLPLLAAVSVVEDAVASPPAAASVSDAGATILVVDDESAVRAVVARGLERGGFRVVQAASALEALQLIERLGAPGAVLTDLTMPGASGSELARWLKERWPALPVIFMSGYPVEQLQREGAIRAGDALLQKPFSPAQLLASVATALARPGSESIPAQV